MKRRLFQWEKEKETRNVKSNHLLSAKEETARSSHEAKTLLIILKRQTVSKSNKADREFFLTQAEPNAPRRQE